MPSTDQAARDRIQTDFDTTLFVEAGAGTGKTHALVGRIVGLVASGRTNIERVAAITFTEAAAAELRDRVLVALERASADTERPAEERACCLEAIGGLDEAAIETLHSFAARLLALYPLEAGLPPGFEVADDTQGAVAFGERWRDHLDAMLGDPELQTPLRHVLTLGVKPDALRDVSRALHEHWDRLEQTPIPSPPRADIAGEADRIARELDAVCEIREHCIDPSDHLQVHLERIAPLGARLRAAIGDDVESLRLLGGRFTTRGGQARNWRGVRPQDVRDALAGLEERRLALRAAVAALAIAALYSSLREFVLGYAAERRRVGRLEFHDLLVQTRDLLRNDAEVRAALRERFSHVLIDEFQDTDPLQTEIAFLLAGSDGTSPADWRKVDVEPGRLFFVGDPKQSIYRFRRADIELYQAVQARFVDGHTRLTQNFRSTPSVIEWVNALFERLMGTGTVGQATYTPLQAARPPHMEQVTVTHLGGPMEGALPAIRSVEAAAITQMLRAAKAEHWQIFDGESGESRDARYQDIGVLLPARTALPPLLETLDEAGIPYRLESRSLVYETQEVQELLAILRAIDDPTDEVALVATLRSPAFACADDELLEFAGAGGRWDYRAAIPDAIALESPVAAAMRWLAEAYERRWWTPVSTLIEQVIRDRRLLELAMVDRRPRERWQRLRFILDQSRAFADAGGRTLREFLVWAQDQADEDARVIESVAPEPDDDAVRIMTVHAAKGLEFPVVVLAGLNAQRQRRPPSVLWDAEGRPELRFASEVTSTGFEALRARNAELDDLEEVRLLYVAATRARDHLVVSLFHREQETASPAARIHAAAQDFLEFWRRGESGEVTVEVAGTPDIPLDTPEEREAWRTQREAAIVQLASVHAVAATALARAAADEAADDPNLQKEPPVEELPPWRRGRAGTAIGRAVHSALQTIDLAGGEGLEETARAQAAAEGVPHRASEVAQLVRAALDAPSVRAAVASGRLWREVYVGVPLDGVLVEGFIDLLYETPEGLVVVDYKTDALASTDSVDHAIERYRLQGAAYATALAASLGRPVARCVFVFLTPGGAIEREIVELDRAMDEVRTRALAMT